MSDSSSSFCCSPSPSPSRAPIVTGYGSSSGSGSRDPGDALIRESSRYREVEQVDPELEAATRKTVSRSTSPAEDPPHPHAPSHSHSHSHPRVSPPTAPPPPPPPSQGFLPLPVTSLLARVVLISLLSLFAHVGYTGWRLTRIISLPNEQLPVWLNVDIHSPVEHEIWRHTIIPNQQASPHGQVHDLKGCIIVVGPVIGLTTDTSTRILLEVSVNTTFRLDVVDVQSKQVYTVKRNVHAHRPAIFVFQQLEPLTRYHIIPYTPCLTGYLYEYADGSTAIGSFRTLPPQGFSLTSANRFAIISCHDIAAVQQRVYHVDPTQPTAERYERNKENDLWVHMARLARKGSLDYLLHVGDQVYADTEENIAWEQRDHLYPPVQPRPWVNSTAVGPLAYPSTYWSAIEVLRNTDKNDWAANYTLVLELYRQIYRVTWSHPPLQYLLSHVPSLMTFDDHEVRDDWGDRPEDSDGHSAEYFVGRMAHRAIVEYQRQLDRDVESWLDAEEWRHAEAHHSHKHHTQVDPNPHDDQLRGMHHFHVMGQIGVMFVDTRGGRAYYNAHDHNHTGELYLGEHQWRDIDSALGPTGLFVNTTVLIVAIPTPIVILSTRAIDILGWGYDDCWGFWSARPYEADQIRFLQALHEWKHLPVAAGQRPRDLIIVSGDIHEGGYSDISFRDEIFTTQVVSSSIGNTPMPLAGLATIVLANALHSRLGDTLTPKHGDSKLMRRIVSSHPSDYHYRHLNFIRPRNYAILDIWGDRPKHSSLAAELANQTAETRYINIYHVMAPQQEQAKPVIVVPRIDDTIVR